MTVYENVMNDLKEIVLNNPGTIYMDVKTLHVNRNGQDCLIRTWSDQERERMRSIVITEGLLRIDTTSHINKEASEVIRLLLEEEPTGIWLKIGHTDIRVTIGHPGDHTGIVHGSWTKTDVMDFAYFFITKKDDEEGVYHVARTDDSNPWDMGAVNMAPPSAYGLDDRGQVVELS